MLLHAVLIAFSSVLLSPPKLAIQVSEGQQYRLAEIRFADAHAFPASELRKQFPIQDGDVFSTVAIRKGLENISRLYGSRGFINMAASTDIAPDKNPEQISVLINLDEGRQFRVGSVKVFGLDQGLWGPTLKTGLLPGKVFNSDLIQAVFNENKPVLPPDASQEHDVRITQDAKSATLAIVFDFRRRP